MDESGCPRDAPDLGLLRLPNEILIDILELLDPADPGVFALSTLCKRLHYLALPIYLAGHGISDTAELAFQDLVLGSTQLDVLAALQTSLFIHSLKHISCSFSLNSARREYTPRDMDHFFRHMSRLSAFLSNLQRVEEVTLNLKDVNFWTISENPEILETWSPIVSTLLDCVLEKGCKALNVEGGMFIVHPSQFQPKLGPRTVVKRRSAIFDVGHRIGSAFLGRSNIREIADPGKTELGKTAAALETFNIHSRMLLLPPCSTWTMSALKTSPNLTSLSIMRVDIPERSWDEILSSIHVPALEDLTFDLRCKIRAAAFDQFLARHPLIKTLSLGRDLIALAEGDVASKDCLANLRHLSATPTYVRFLMTDKRAPAVQTLRLVVKVASNAIFKTAAINCILVPCHPRIERVHLTLVVIVDHVSSHWAEFFQDSEEPGENIVPQEKNSLQHARALELVATSASDAFEALALRLLPLFPALQSLSASGCSNNSLNAPSFVSRVKEACPELQRVTLDGRIYDAVF
ncbi:hypothetical protein B0H17DRAFT_105286 [Mycena rosella]|uniref:F-box domain-containing protein n=1 Tax=Mycena rosella TaxID=1033263 RepID=A0AAD7D4Q1_MYCRO|nr:hypothetical protein B0H17DRAFT_105286 [Mycena rosella]